MQLQRFWIGMVAVLFANVSAQAETPEKADVFQEARVEAVHTLAKVAELVRLGRGELKEETGLKTFQSPEVLVAAGGMLLRAAATLGEIEVINEKGESSKEKTEKPASLKSQANDLFDEALAMVGNDRSKQASIQKLIADAKDLPKQPAESRPAVGRPRLLVRTLVPGQTFTVTIPFVPAAPAVVSYDSQGGGRQKVEIFNEVGKKIYENTGKSGSHSWKTARDKDFRAIIIHLTNVGTRPHQVTITTN